jgi:hypothetical protein
MKLNEIKSKNKTKQNNKNEKNKYLNKKRNRSTNKTAKNINSRKLISEKKIIKKNSKSKNKKNTSIKSKKFEKKNKNVINFKEKSTKQTNKKKNDASMKLIYEIKNDVQKEFDNLKESDKKNNNKIEKLLQKNNLNNDVVFQYLKNIALKEVKVEEIKFLKFTLSLEQQNLLIRKTIFTDAFDTKQELINMLKNIKDNEDLQKTLDEFKQIKSKINLEKIINPFIYTLNYDQDNMFAFCFFLILEFLEMNISQIKSAKNIIKKFFSDYINSLNKENINKDELLYIYFSFFNYESVCGDTLTKINENIKDKKEKENIFEKFKKVIKEHHFNEKDKDISLTKLNYILDEKWFDEELFNEIYENQIFLFKKVQEQNYFFFNKNMKNNYLLHLKKLLFSKIMNKIFKDFEDDFIENLNQQNKKLNFNYLFKNENAFEELKSHFYFFPFDIERSIKKVSGLTIKNTLDLIIFVYPRNIIELINLIQKYKENKKKIFFFNHIVNSAYFFLTIIHESSGHYLFTYYYYLDSSKITTSTPKKSKINEYLKKKLGDKVENYDRGSQIEGLLFGDIVTSLTFWGAIFILTVNFSKINNYEELATKFNQYNKKKIEKKLLENLDLEGSDILKEILNKYGFSTNDLKENFLEDYLENLTLRIRSSNCNFCQFDVYLNNDVMGNYDVVLSKEEKIRLMGFK